MPATTPSQDYHTVVPYLVVENVAALIDFTTRAFGAVERFRMHRPDGSVFHAEVTIGDSIVMMGEPSEAMGPMPATIFLRVKDCDAAYRRAIDCGATSIKAPQDQPRAGERYGGVMDSCGNRWWPSTRLATREA